MVGTVTFLEAFADLHSQELCVTDQEWVVGTFPDPSSHRLLWNDQTILTSEKCPMDILFSLTKMS